MAQQSTLSIICPLLAGSYLYSRDEQWTGSGLQRFCFRFRYVPECTSLHIFRIWTGFELR